jgi:hypothetical protein
MRPFVCAKIGIDLATIDCNQFYIGYLGGEFGGLFSSELTDH